MTGTTAEFDGTKLGMVVAGSLTEGVEVRLDEATSTEQIKVGTFVTVKGQKLRFFGVVTDVSLGSTDPNLSGNPPDVSNPYVWEVIVGSAAYGTISVEPMLTIASADDPMLGLNGPQPAKTVPGHFASVHQASDHDVESVFGSEDEHHFWIGTPLDMETRLCLDIPELVERSNGIFGKSGTGKTFLTRLLLIGILQKGEANNLVFDMHSEYGWKGSSETRAEVKGLKQLFPSKVAVFSLDEESSRRRGLTPDYVVRIGYDEIEPGDIQLLRENLNLSEVSADSAFSLEKHFGSEQWLQKFLSIDGRQTIFELANQIGVQANALASLHNRLSRLERYAFMDATSTHGSVQEIIRYLDRGMHVVLEFGRYGNDIAAYILVANLLTRRIYGRYVERSDKAARGEENTKPLVITVEEAHKFLTPEVAGQTIFGQIAREMRKYKVRLLIVDQRPSGIDEEVMSQLGTKITYLLDSSRDIDAVLAGESGSRKLRSVLARLESKQQALAFGHALPMPVVIETREYGTPESYRELGWRDQAELKAELEKDVDSLFGPNKR